MRILFTATPGAGHVHPMVPLALAMRARGHEVVWATAAEAAPGLASQGFDVLPCGPGFGPSFAELHERFPELRTMAPADRPPFMFPRLFGLVRAGPVLGDLLPAARQWRPDLVVHDQADFAAPIAAAVLGVTNVAHSFGAVLPVSRLADVEAYVAPLWEAHGLEPRPYGGAYDHLYVDIYPPSLQVPDTGHLRAIQHIRPVPFASPGQEPMPVWPAEVADRPLVYATFGTVFNDPGPLATAVEGVRDLDVRVLVTLGPGRDPGMIGPQPPNVHVAGYLAQTDVLPSASAVVSHAGSGTFLAALANALPQVLLPQAADQYLNAAAGARSGAGIALVPGEATVGAVRQAAGRVLEDSGFRGSAATLAAEIAAMPDPDAAAAAIEATVA